MFSNDWPVHHQCVKTLFSAVRWFPKCMKLTQFPKQFKKKVGKNWLKSLKMHKILRKPKRWLPQVLTAGSKTACPVLMYLHLFSLWTCFWRLWESTAVWRKRRTCCYPLCQPCRRKLSIWSTTWAQRLASNWTCSLLWETPADSWKSLKVSHSFLLLTLSASSFENLAHTFDFWSLCLLHRGA